MMPAVPPCRRAAADQPDNRVGAPAAALLNSDFDRFIAAWMAINQFKS
jgi:hypothetical protein